MENLILTKVYGAKGYTLEEITSWLERYGEPLRPFIRETGRFLMGAAAAGKRILFEAQLGALRDLEHGICPYTTSSNTLAAYALMGSGMPSGSLDEVVGVVKAYSTCVGEGPFVCEWFGPEADELRTAARIRRQDPGRPRRVGPSTSSPTRYGVRLQGATCIALTKLDVLGYMDKIPLCVAYEVDGAETRDFPFPAALEGAKPVVEYMDGWKCDISHARQWTDLPLEARRYVRRIEQETGCPIRYVSVGAGRDEYIKL